MRVGLQRGARLGVAQGPLDGHDVAAGRDQSGGVEVPQVVQPEVPPARRPRRTAGTARRRRRGSEPPRPGRDGERRRPPALAGKLDAVRRVHSDQRSRTAARKTDRTFTNRVLIVPGAGAARDSVGVAIDFTQVSMCVVRIFAALSTGTTYPGRPGPLPPGCSRSRPDEQPSREELLERDAPWLTCRPSCPHRPCRAPREATAEHRPSGRRCAGARCPAQDVDTARASALPVCSPIREVGTQRCACSHRPRRACRSLSVRVTIGTVRERRRGDTVRTGSGDARPALPGCGRHRHRHAWAGVLVVPRDWCATVGLDPATGLGWAGGYVGHGVTWANRTAHAARRPRPAP